MISFRLAALPCVLWSWRWRVMVGSGAAVLTVVTLDLWVRPRQYESRALLLVPDQGVGLAASGSTQDPLAGQVVHAADVMVSVGIARRTREQVAVAVGLGSRVPGAPTGAEQVEFLEERVRFRMGGSGQVELVCTAAGTPRGLTAPADETARRLCRDIAEAYIDCLEGTLSELTQRERTATRMALEAVVTPETDGAGTDADTAAQGRDMPALLAERLALARAAEQRRGPAFYVLDPPSLPLRAHSPRPVRDLALSLVAIAVVALWVGLIGVAQSPPPGADE